ncbi:MAG: hypothetical protein IKC78_02245 [Alistipes sp.]|nr:hypothetical protein [Alistipes sp.]
MKRFLSSIIAIAVIFVFVSCGNSANYSSKKGRHDGKFIWEHQLDYVKEHNSVADNPLKLIKYKYVKPVDGIFDAFFYMRSTFSDKAYFGFESMRTDCKFEVFQKKDFVEKYSEDAEKALDRIKDEVAKRFAVVNCVHIVEITWEYLGERFKTRALVATDDMGVLYDNIATVIPNPRPKDNVAWKRYIRPFDISKDGNLALNNTKDKLTFKTFYMDNHHPSMNYVGRYMWEYTIACESKFLSKDGLYYGMNMGSRYSSELGYKCEAKVSSLAGESLQSKYHTFEWRSYTGTTPLLVTILNDGLHIGGSGEHRKGLQTHIGNHQMAVR